MKYYEVLTDDNRYADRWFLDEPLTEAGEQIDARDLSSGKPYAGPTPAVVPITTDGRRVAFNLAALDMVVVASDLSHILEDIAPLQIQRFPVVVGTNTLGYEIVNVVSRVPCIDEARSEIMRWRPEDGRPDRVGRYRMVTTLTIDPSRADGYHIFRILDWEVALVVSEEVRKAIQGFPNLGVNFALIGSD